MKYPVLPIEVAVEPRRDEDRKRLTDALAAIASDAPQFACSIDHESGQTILKSLGESELEALVVRLKGEFGIEMNVGAPQVAYRETITKTVLEDHEYKQQGGLRYARVKIQFEALPPGSGFIIANTAPEDAVPTEYLPGVTKGLLSAAQSGVIAGFPVIDCKATLIDGAHHPVDSNIVSFDIAARACFRKAIPKAKPKLLEPMMEVEVIAPEEYVDEVINDLGLRRTLVTVASVADGRCIVKGTVPLANMFGYESALRSTTAGRANYLMHFSHWQPIPISRPDDDDPPMAMALRP